MSSQEKAAWVQAVAACITLIVTIIYVVYTNKLVHSPHRTVIRLSRVVSEKSDEYRIKARNLGPAIAADVKIEAVIWNVRQVGYNSDPNKIPTLINMVKVNAYGQADIGVGEDTEYRVRGKLYYKMPITISWRTITGKKQKCAWKVDTKKGYELNKIGTLSQMRYQMIWIIMNIRTLFVKAKCYSGSVKTR